MNARNLLICTGAVAALVVPSVAGARSLPIKSPVKAAALKKAVAPKPKPKPYLPLSINVQGPVGTSIIAPLDTQSTTSDNSTDDSQDDC